MRAGRPLVLFDIDGTLLRGAGPHHRLSLVEGIRRVTGMTTTLEGVDTSGMLDRDLIAAMLRTAGASRRRVNRDLRRIMSACQSAYLENCAADLTTKVCSGVRETLQELRSRGAVLGLVTGNLSRIGWKKMELARLNGFFSIGGFAEDGATRAHVAAVAARRAIHRRLVARSSLVSLVGDHINDIAAAKANGFQAVAVATGLLPMDELRSAGPEMLLRDLRELDLNRIAPDRNASL